MSKMNDDLHVVLGASGVVGKAIISELKEKNLRIRAVGRTKNVDDVEMVNADLLDLNQIKNAIIGASHVYLCVGITYSTKEWEEKWPKIMKNVITACEAVKARLIFLDNVYMYGPSPLKIPFTELHKQDPPSQKGKVRKTIADMLMEAHKSGRIEAVIGRSADFYGPNVLSSPVYISFLEKMLKGKSPQSISSIKVKHTYSYTPDDGRALVALALDHSTYGQVWHLPVSDPVTMEELTAMYNKILGTDLKISMIPRPMINLLGIFIPPIKEFKEMLYQFDNPYIMNYDKFKHHFPGFRVTPLETGLREMVNSFKGV